MKINNVSDYISLLSKAPVDFENLFFRGHSNESFSLKPNLYRKENYFVNEDKIFKEAILNHPNEFNQYNTTIENLVILQHYGIPTRLLDITRNPLIALYFTCCEHKSLDGEVILFNVPIRFIRFYDSDKVTILANIAKQQVDFGYDYKEKKSYLKEVDLEAVNNRYFSFLLHSIKDDKPHFKDIINPKDINNVYVIQAKLNNLRIVRQSGAFFIFGIKNTCEGEGGKSYCSEIPQSWIVKPNNEKIIVPHYSKRQILIELDAIGINENTLFPELTTFADYAKKKYGGL